jgi:hypothetical protein
MKQQETPLKFQSLSLKNPSEIYPAESSADVDAKSTCMQQTRKTRKVPGSQKERQTTQGYIQPYLKA